MAKVNDLLFEERKGAVCSICGVLLPVYKNILYNNKKMFMCGFCHEKAFIDNMEYMHHYSTINELKQPRVKFNVPKSTVEKRKWLAGTLCISQGDVDILAVDILYDIFTIMPGRMETSPKGITELVSRIRLSIIRAGIDAQNKRIIDNYNQELADTTITGPKATGDIIGGKVRTGFKSRS